MNQRRLLLLSLLAPAMPTARAQAPTWPVRPLRVIVPIAAGSVVDLVPRIVFERLPGQLGQPVIVENRPGAGQTLGTSLAAQAKADGHTLLVNSSAHTIAPALHPNLPYHPSRDFVAIASLGATPFVLVVSPQKGFRTARELVAAGKANPGLLNYGSPGVGSASHLSAERFRMSAGLQAVHVPFKGGVEAMTEVIAGRIDFFFMALGAALPQIRQGRLAPLAVNSAARSPALPDVPSLAEAGIRDAEYPTWLGVFAPAGTPAGVVEHLHREILEALKEPAVREKLIGLGVDEFPMTPGELDAFVARQLASDAAMVKALGLKSQ